MIREALTERLPPPFKDVDPIHYFGTNQIESQSDFVEFVLSLLMEKDFFRRRDNPDRPVEVTSFLEVKIPLLSNGGFNSYEENTKVFNKTKEILYKAFPSIKLAPWNSSFVDNDNDIAIIVNGGKTLVIRVNNPKKVLPQFHKMNESQKSFNDIDYVMMNEVDSITEEVIDDIVPSFGPIEAAISSKNKEIDDQIEALHRRKRHLNALKNHLITKFKRETKHIKDLVNEQCEEQNIFAPIRNKESERDREIASWSLL